MSTPLYNIELSYEANSAGPGETLPPVPEEVLGVVPDRRLFGFPVGYPIGVPASPLTANSHWINTYASQGFNVLTYKTIRRLETPALPAPNWLFARGLTRPLPVGEPMPSVRVDPLRRRPDDLYAHSMVNSCGIPSPVPAVWQKDIRRSLQVLRPGQLLIVSVVGEYEELSGQALIDDFVECALLAEAAGAAIIELNLSCPNSVSRLEGGLRAPICDSPADTRDIVLAARAALGRDTKLVAKLGYLNRQKLEGVMTEIADSVDGIAGINTWQVDVADEENGPIFLGTLERPDEARRKAGLSGIALRDYALEFVRSLALLRRKYDWDFEIVAMGGVMEPHDVRALMASGADAVQTATAAENNPELPRQICSIGHPLPSEDERLAGLIEAALSDPSWDFRTVDGLAAELRLSTAQIRHLLDTHPDAGRRSVMSDRKGRDLYAATTHKPGMRERIEQLRWILAR